MTARRIDMMLADICVIRTTLLFFDWFGILVSELAHHIRFLSPPPGTTW